MQYPRVTFLSRSLLNKIDKCGKCLSDCVYGYFRGLFSYEGKDFRK